MGCGSSTEVFTDPHTGETKTKKKLGGAYPGQRRPNQGPHAPSAGEFGKDGVAVSHFKAYGGGNALTMVQQHGSTPSSGGPSQGTPEYIQVTLPDGVSAGQLIHVAAPDGSINAITVPPGMGPGSVFTVEFVREETAPTTAQAVPASANESYGLPAATASAAQPSADGFAAGFNNPNYKPPVTATATTTFSDDYYTQYPTSTNEATPVYGSGYGSAQSAKY